MSKIEKRAKKLTSTIFDALHGGEHGWEDMTDEKFEEFTNKIVYKIKGPKENDYQLAAVAQDLLHYAKCWDLDKSKYKERSPLYRKAAAVLVKAASGWNRGQACCEDSQTCTNEG